MQQETLHNQSLGLPRAIPRFDIRAKFVPAFNQAKRCQGCLSELNLPNVALPRIKILRVVLAQYGYEKDEQGNAAVGGLDLEVHQLDKSLVKSYPVDITVVARSARRHKSHEKELIQGSKGSLSVYKLPHFGRYANISLTELKKLLDQGHFDLIHLHRVKGPAVRAFVKEAESRNIPVVMTHHNGLPEKKFNKKSVKQRISDFISNLYGTADQYGLFATIASLGSNLLNVHRSRFIKTDLYKNILAGSSEIFCGSPLVAVSEYGSKIYGNYPAIAIGSAIDTEFFRPEKVTDEEKKKISIKTGIPGTENLICYHARMTPAKGQIDLVRVASELLKAGFKDFHFVLCGSFEDKIYTQSLRSEIDNLNLSSYFTLNDTLDQNDIRALLSISSVLTFPTHYESLGRTGIEAMLMKVPVVANNVGGIPGYIKNSETGFLVMTQDYKAMADRIIDLLKEPELREKIANQAEKYARKTFNAADIARQYMELCYANMLQRKFSSADI